MQFSRWLWDGGGVGSEVGGTGGMTAGMRADSQSQVQAFAFVLQVSITSWSSSCRSRSWMTSSSFSWRSHRVEWIESLLSEFKTFKPHFRPFWDSFLPPLSEQWQGLYTPLTEAWNVRADDRIKCVRKKKMKKKHHVKQSYELLDCIWGLHEGNTKEKLFTLFIISLAATAFLCSTTHCCFNNLWDH